MLLALSLDKGKEQIHVYRCIHSFPDCWNRDNRGNDSYDFKADGQGGNRSVCNIDWLHYCAGYRNKWAF